MKQKIFTNCFLVKTGNHGVIKEVCLAMKKRGFGRGMWNGSGGKPNEGESVDDAARREVEEELCVKVKKLEKRGIINFTLRVEDKNVQMHAFLVKEWEGNPVETEEMKPQWFEIESVPYIDMWKSDSEWLPIMLSGKKFLATYTYEREGGEVETREIKEVDSL